MFRMIGAEFFKLRKRPMTWWMLGIMAAITVVFFTVNYLLGHHSGNAATARASLHRVYLPQGASTAVTAASALWVIFLVVAIAVAMGNEFQYGTLRTQLAMGLRRIPYILAKAIAVFAAGVIGLALIVLLGIGLSALLTAVDGAPMQWGGAFGQAFWQGIGAELLGTATTFALALFITLLARQVVTGVAVVLGYTILENTITGLLTALGGGWARAVSFFLTPNERALSYGLDRSQEFNKHLLPTGTAAALLVAYGVIFLAAGIAIFEWRDVKGAG
jgi:ABC-2 type transport system permease protein